MGNFFSSPFFKFFRVKDEMRIFLWGLDAAGKTTILYKLKLGEIVTTIPTIGFNVETVEYKNISITAWDLGGRDKSRPLWRHYYQNSPPHLVIFVVDSNDRERMAEVKDEIFRIFKEKEFEGVPFLFYLNKQDLPNAMKAQEISKELGLASIKDREFYMQECCATSGEGLHEGLEWASAVVKRGPIP